MSDQIRDTNFLELLSQQEKTACYLQLLKEAKVAVKRKELNDKQYAYCTKKTQVTV